MAKIGLRIKVRDKIKDWVLSRAKKIRHARINGYDLLVPVDEGLGWSAYYLKRYDRAETNFLKRLVQKDWISFDIGANVGYYSLLFASLAKGGAVHAFEPVPLHGHLLNASILLNRFTNITVNYCALDRQAGMSDFAVSKRMGDSALVPAETTSSQQVIRVPVCTLDDYVTEKKIGRIDLVKIDVEGAERRVLEGSRGSCQTKSCVPAFFSSNSTILIAVVMGRRSAKPSIFLKATGTKPLLFPVGARSRSSRSITMRTTTFFS